MFDRPLFAALALASICACAPAVATTVPLAADGQWQAFSVDALLSSTAGVEWIDDSNGSALDFSFTVATGTVATLTVVDGALGGDTFQVTNFGHVLGATSAVPQVEYANAKDLGLDFDAALADPAFSHGSFQLAAGRYSIGGLLLQSVLLDGAPLDATAGAVRLTVAPVSAVPEPSTAVLLALGLAALGSVAGRRRT